MRIVIAIEKQNMGYQSKRLRLRESLHIVNGLTTLRWEFRLYEEFHVFEYNL